jgi:hypothetical protein
MQNLLWSAVASPIQGLGLRGIKAGLQQGFAPGEMGFNDKFALQKSSTSTVLLATSVRER